MSLKYLSAPTKTLATSLNSSGMVLRVSDIKGWNGLDLTASDFGTIAYIVLRNATNTAIEIIEIDATTIAAGNITINKRGLKFEGDRTTEVAANKLAWVQGSTLVDLGASTPQMLQTLQENFEAAIIAGGVPATTSVLGLNRMSTAPVDPAVPIALGENDGRVPTADEKAILVAIEDGTYFPTPQVVTFTSSGTWTKDAGLKYVVVEVQGAGAGGAGEAGVGGGAGGYARKLIPAASLGATETVTIATGGAGQSGGVGVDGSGATTFVVTSGVNVVANRGLGDRTGGTATGGDVNITGQSGGNAGGSNTGFAQQGGDAMLGKGGASASGNTSSSSGGANGNAATGYGGGGSAARPGSDGAFTGGNGTAGIVIVTEYY